MSKKCTFEQLPEKLKSEITSQSDYHISQGGQAYRPIQCSVSSSGNTAQCFIESDGIFGIFELWVKEVKAVWISSSEVKMLYDHLGELWKDRTIEKSPQ